MSGINRASSSGSRRQRDPDLEETTAGTPPPGPSSSRSRNPLLPSGFPSARLPPQSAGVGTAAQPPHNKSAFGNRLYSEIQAATTIEELELIRAGLQSALNSDYITREDKTSFKRSISIRITYLNGSRSARGGATGQLRSPVPRPHSSAGSASHDRSAQQNSAPDTNDQAPSGTHHPSAPSGDLPSQPPPRHHSSRQQRSGQVHPPSSGASGSGHSARRHEAGPESSATPRREEKKTSPGGPLDDILDAVLWPNSKKRRFDPSQG
jgi:hypothetical protein